MRMTARQLNRATLARQLLLRREAVGVTEAVRRVVALQAQEAASPYLALWNRLTAFDPADLDAAFACQAVVKATLMRLTLHAVHADDYPAFRGAMLEILRAARLDDSRFIATGLSAADADALVPHLRSLAGELDVLEGPAGTELFDLPGAARPGADTPAPPRLLGMWDSILLAYADRSRLTPPEYRPLIMRGNGDILPTLLVDGQVAGVWRAVAGGIEATAFRPLPEQAWHGLAAEARALVWFLAGREPAVYRRYTHWWAGLPRAEVRVLTG
jgi:Winged helix DNA-binding domain